VDLSYVYVRKRIIRSVWSRSAAIWKNAAWAKSEHKIFIKHTTSISVRGKVS
jgi:hypothetical protein